MSTPPAPPPYLRAPSAEKSLRRLARLPARRSTMSYEGWPRRRAGSAAMMLGKAQMHGRGSCFGAEQDSGLDFRYFVVGLSVQRHILALGNL
jgi:hypothetical protein